MDKNFILAIFALGRGETFLDGTDSVFSFSLMRVIEDYGIEALDYIDELLSTGKIGGEVMGEAMRWIGRIEDEHQDRRFGILLKALKHPDLYVRDGAVLGLSSMDNPDAIPFLKEAAENEPITGLKEDMLETIDLLVLL